MLISSRLHVNGVLRWRVLWLQLHLVQFLGPLISGFTAPVSWRWPFWILLMLAGVTIPFILIMPESYAPVILARKAARMRQETGNKNIVSRKDLESQSMNYVITMVMTRPFRMLFHESIVLFTCMYLSLAYAIFYLYFEAYPIIFQGPNSVYHFNAGETGLVGALVLSFSRRNRGGQVLFIFDADQDFAGIPPNWHRCGSMLAPFLSLRLIPGKGAGEKDTLESDRGISTPATGLRWGSIICGLAFLDRLVCKGRRTLDCSNSQWNHVWDGISAHFHGHVELFDRCI